MLSRWIRIGCAFLCAAAALAALSAPSPARGDSPVANHPELPAAATVWCLAEPARLAEAARGLGVDVGNATAGTSFAFAGTKGDAAKWALSADEAAASDFARACRTAFVAFRHAGIGLALYGLAPGQLAQALESDDSNGLDEELLSGAGGVLLGAILAGLGGLGAAHIRVNRADAQELRQLDAEFRNAFERHVADKDDVVAMRDAQLSARLLRYAVAEWAPGRVAQAIPKGVPAKEVEATVAALNKLLDGEGSEPPRIGDFEPGEIDLLRSWASEAHDHLAKAAAGVGSIARLTVRKPAANGKVASDAKQEKVDG
jgi:hypothetical protein